MEERAWILLQIVVLLLIGISFLYSHYTKILVLPWWGLLLSWIALVDGILQLVRFLKPTKR
jgi:hypothetical protein